MYWQPCSDQLPAPDFRSLLLEIGLIEPAERPPVQYAFGGIVAFVFDVDFPYEALDSLLQEQLLNASPSNIL